MTSVTNKHTGPLALPGGPTLQPGQTRDVARWNVMRHHNVVSAWLRAGVLKVEDEVVEPVSAAVIEDTMEHLRAEAESIGIDVDGRWGEKRLRSEIEKAR